MDERSIRSEHCANQAGTLETTIPHRAQEILELSQEFIVSSNPDS